MKIDRQALIAEATRPSAAAGELKLSGLGERLMLAWRAALGCPVPSLDASFFDIGGDSLSATTLSLHLEGLVDISIDASFAFDHPKFDDQLAKLEAASLTPKRHEDPLIVDFLEQSPTNSNPLLVFLPGGGGHVFPYQPIVERLAPDWTAIGLLHPRLRPEEVRVLTINDVAARFRKALAHLPVSQPIIIVGYSIGGIIGYELARQLTQAGHACAVLMIDARPRQLLTPRGKADAMQTRLRLQYWRQKKRLKQALGLSKDEAKPAIQVGSNVRTDVLMAPISKDSHKYKPVKSDVPAYVISARDNVRPGAQDDLGWSKVARVLGTASVPGDHYTLYQDEKLGGFCDALRDGLVLLSDQCSSRKADAK